MSHIKIGFFNQSTVMSDTEVIKHVVAIQHQVRNEWANIWGFDADIIWQPKGSAPRSGMWHMVYFDNADQAGALGYHDITAEGLPLGKVFAKTTLDNKGLVSVTASHETLEMLGDPDVNLIAAANDASGATKLYAYEVCDAVEDDSLGYKSVNGVVVSDFVTPAWFESFRTPGSTAFSYKKNVTAPFQLAPGGYIGVLDPTTGWSQVTARADYSYSLRPHPGSRRDKRRTPRDQWMKSTGQPW